GTTSGSTPPKNDPVACHADPGATHPTAGVGGRGRPSRAVGSNEEWPAGSPLDVAVLVGRESKDELRAMAGQKIRIRLKAYDHEVIDTSARQIVDTVTRTGAKVAGPVPPPTEKNVYCVIRSPHKYKDSREHFEMR